jgi:rare lipoprotein A
MRKLIAAAACVALVWTGCGRKKRVRVMVPAVVGSVESGVASWYGHPYHGRASASGETYDMETLTAAHRTLPFGTWVRVHNLRNEKTVEVRITDRGPFIDGRIIDLSRAAARAIDMIGPGTAPVRVEVIASSQPAAATSDAFAVQVGAFQNRGNAERVRAAMEQRYGRARMVLRQSNPPVWRVLVGLEPTMEAASGLAGRIRRDAGAEHGEAFVVRVDSQLPPAARPAL